MHSDSIESYGRPGESLDQTRARLRGVVDHADADAITTALNGIAGGAEFMRKSIEVFAGRQAAMNWMTAPAIGLGSQRPVDLFADGDTRQAVVDYLGRLEYGVWS